MLLNLLIPVRLKDVDVFFILLDHFHVLPKGLFKGNQYLRAGYTFSQWGWMLYISVLGTVIPFGLFFVGVNLIRSTRAPIAATLEPMKKVDGSIVVDLGIELG